MEADKLFKTPLYDLHIKSNAKMIDFGGWIMPVQYEGIIKEHVETRTNVTAFDICHMGEFICEGSGAETALSNVLTADLSSLKQGKCRYGFILNNDAGIIDDCITYKLSKEKYMIVVNASRISPDYKWIAGHIQKDITLNNISDNTGKIDVQGPKSSGVVEKLFSKSFKELSYFAFESFKWNNADIIVSRTGYTGELGYEIYAPTAIIVNIWEQLIKIGVAPAGLGARDTLRLEAGLPLYGHEFTEEITPACSGFKKFANKKVDFIGKKALLSIKPNVKLTGFKLDTRQSVRNLNKVFIADKEAGWVTSGSFAPSLGYSIGFAYIKEEIKIEEFLIDTGRKKLSAVVCKFPFYKTKSSC